MYNSSSWPCLEVITLNIINMCYRLRICPIFQMILWILFMTGSTGAFIIMTYTNPDPISASPDNKFSEKHGKRIDLIHH